VKAYMNMMKRTIPKHLRSAVALYIKQKDEDDRSSKDGMEEDDKD
jgi:hypothetical protein